MDRNIGGIIQTWESIGNKNTVRGRVFRAIFYVTVMFLFYECVTINFDWLEQAILGLLIFVVALWINRASKSDTTTLALICMSLISTARYAYWRFSTVYAQFIDPASKINFTNGIFVLVLLGAEAYEFIVLVLGYVQSTWPLKRLPFPLVDNIELWPDVDVLIPTYNEPLTLVSPTFLAAANIDWPTEKLHVYVLDDGRRPEFRTFCEKAKIGYITRNDNKGAKAGNINHALLQLRSPYMAIFDCDHVPTRSFLQLTMGWMLHDPKLCMIQTPHYFYSPDPFERNLLLYNKVPAENELFYKLVQDGNDTWNATFFCGSCAVLRRSVLEQVGGFATVTVTEDAHTSLLMQMHGWNTAYINIPQAAGLATGSIAAHIGQRIRWARGMVQILRLDNPLIAKGLTWPQRLCYFNAMIHHLFAGPRLVFLVAPLVYILLNRVNIPGYWAAILAYFLPHLMMANITNFRIQGKYRYSFWNEIYETALAPYILIPTIWAYINPKHGIFNVTMKGNRIAVKHFDMYVALPYIILLMLNIAGLITALVRYFFTDNTHPGVLAVNLAWVIFNIVILGIVNAVALELRQQRNSQRIPFQGPVKVRFRDGQKMDAEGVDISTGGFSMVADSNISFLPEDRIVIEFDLRMGSAQLPAKVVQSGKDGLIHAQFEGLDVYQQELLAVAIYSSADTWISHRKDLVPDSPLRSLGHIVLISMRGITTVFASIVGIAGRRQRPVKAMVTLFFMVAFLLSAGLRSHAQPRQHGQEETARVPYAPAQVLPPRQFNSSLTLKDIGVPDNIVLRGVNDSQNADFSLPEADVVRQATLKLHYAFSPGLLGQISHLNVILNGELFATIPVPQYTGKGQGELMSDLPMPTNLLVQNNTLTFQFIGHYTLQCEDPSNSVLWARIGSETSIEISGDLLPLSSDLKFLPLPFYDNRLHTKVASIPFAFLASPDMRTLEAAGIVASWFGLQAGSVAVYFPVTMGILPMGNVVLFEDDPSRLSAIFNVKVGGPMITMRTNPNDPYGKVLIVAGNNGNELRTAAQMLVLQGHLLQGDEVNFEDTALPPARKADDAPRWAPTDRTEPILDYSTSSSLQGDGSVPLAVYVRVAPDLYYGDIQNIPLHIDYRYNAIPLSSGSTLRVIANGAYVTDVPLPHSNEAMAHLARTVPIPVVNMRPFSNTLLFNFFFRAAKNVYCQDVPAMNLYGAILRNSYLDVSDIPHWAAMPDLELFSNAGFPFTRYADLAQTTVILPPSPTQGEISIFLSLLAYDGAQTGYPALRVTVSGAEGLSMPDKDYLVIGTANDQPLFDGLNSNLPVTLGANGLQVRNISGFFARVQRAWWEVVQMRPNWWWKVGSPGPGGTISDLEVEPDAIIEGIESPLGTDRSVIAIHLRDEQSAVPFIQAFLETSQSGDISDSVSVMYGTKFSSYRLGLEEYHVGHLPFWLRLRSIGIQYPWIIVLTIVLISYMLALWFRSWLRQRAWRRLNEVRPS